MNINFEKLDRLELLVAALRGQYDSLGETLELLKRNVRLRHQTFYARLLIGDPTLPPSPRVWLERLDDKMLAAAGIRRPDVEELADNTERAGRLAAAREKISAELQPLNAVLNRCQDYVEQSRGGLTL